jgi:hypothetical protein
MKRARQLLSVAALVLLVAGTALAAVQGRDGVYWLGIEGWQLCAKDGEPCLVPFKGDWSDRISTDKHRMWAVSVPTIKCESGKFLGGDPKGLAPSVHLVADKGDNTKWVFEVVNRLAPGPSEERGIKAGHSGFTFRVKLGEGPFKDWYLAAEAPPEVPKGAKDKATGVRHLKLVRSVKEATVFKYVETNYFVNHL